MIFGRLLLMGCGCEGFMYNNEDVLCARTKILMRTPTAGNTAMRTLTAGNTAFQMRTLTAGNTTFQRMCTLTAGNTAILMRTLTAGNTAFQMHSPTAGNTTMLIVSLMEHQTARLFNCGSTKTDRQWAFLKKDN